ncbi:hypothetical protein OSB04_031614 [Centaurea solstitialis]|uniref:Uncharacterized protein n=1 Tax=Centaurea solstitialis TaxID=347529 RepID=A0AA38W896_9ASTR|nr:hypothetical protein OSB04_031614 [Centaurea solstitialis]
MVLFSSLLNTPFFNVSFLKRAIGKHTIEVSLPSGMGVDSVTPLRPVRCLSTRMLSTDGSQIQQWLIHIEEATWEDAYTIQFQFSYFRLEAKPNFQDYGNDKDQPMSPTQY